MNANRFDDLLRDRPEVSPRRGVLRGLVVLALTAAGLPGAVDAKKKHKRKKKERIRRNSFGCVSFGNACKNSEQCCSGICQGKKGKKKCQEHDAGTCQDDQDVCGEGFPTCGTAGLCFRTTGQASFCGQAATCLECQTDTKCQVQFGPGAACVVCVSVRTQGIPAAAKSLPEVELQARVRNP